MFMLAVKTDGPVKTPDEIAALMAAVLAAISAGEGSGTSHGFDGRVFAHFVYDTRENPDVFMADFRDVVTVDTPTKEPTC